MIKLSQEELDLLKALSFKLQFAENRFSGKYMNLIIKNDDVSKLVETLNKVINS